MKNLTGPDEPTATWRVNHSGSGSPLGRQRNDPDRAITFEKALPL
jgi:hypothetical protein